MRRLHQNHVAIEMSQEEFKKLAVTQHGKGPIPDLMRRIQAITLSSGRKIVVLSSDDMLECLHLILSYGKRSPYVC